MSPYTLGLEFDLNLNSSGEKVKSGLYALKIYRDFFLFFLRKNGTYTLAINLHVIFISSLSDLHEVLVCIRSNWIIQRSGFTSIHLLAAWNYFYTITILQHKLRHFQCQNHIFCANVTLALTSPNKRPKSVNTRRTDVYTWRHSSICYHLYDDINRNYPSSHFASAYLVVNRKNVFSKIFRRAKNYNWISHMTKHRKRNAKIVMRVMNL